MERVKIRVKWCIKKESKERDWIMGWNKSILGGSIDREERLGGYSTVREWRWNEWFSGL